MIIKKLNSLISLLDDPNEIVFESVSRALLNEEIDIIPVLRTSLEQINNEPARTRLKYIIKRIEFHQCRTGLLEWIEDGAEDLLYGAYLIAKLEYSDLDFYHLAEEIDAIGSELQNLIEKKDDSREKIKVVNKHLFETLGLRRNQESPLDFHNNYLPDVLQCHKGNQVSLTIIYLILCERLSLPISIIKQQKVVLLSFDDIFFINPMNKGEIIERNDLHGDFEKTNHLFLIKLLLLTLQYSLDQNNDEREGDVLDLVNLIKVN